MDAADELLNRHYYFQGHINHESVRKARNAVLAMVRLDSKAPITIEADGLRATVRVEGVGEAHGDYLKNPVTGERHEAHIVLPDGFIWTKGECGVGSYRAAAEGIDLSFQDTNWILYDFDWSNAEG